MTAKKYKNTIMTDSRSKRLNFEPDNRLHYVYRVSNKYITYHYYGSKTEDVGIVTETIGVSYFTSSANDIFERGFRDYPNDWEVTVVKRFDNPADKMIFESYLHDYHDVKNHSDFINRSNQTPFGFDTTGKFIGKNNPSARGVYQINPKTLTIVALFETLKAAAKTPTLKSKTNANAIGMCARGMNQTAGGYIWIYEKDFDENTLSNLQGIDFIKVRSVFQWCLKTGVLLEEFNCVVDAFEKTGVSINQINGCASGRYKTAGEFVWTRTKDDTLVLALIASNHNPRTPTR